MADKINGKNIEKVSEINKCSTSKCFIDNKLNNKDTLACRKCKRAVHYACSGLPAYQIQLCLTFKARSFQCQNCVEILPEIQEKSRMAVKTESKS